MDAELAVLTKIDSCWRGVSFIGAKHLHVYKPKPRFLF